MSAEGALTPRCPKTRPRRCFSGLVRRELHGTLDCGILANGFARVHGSSCGRDELVAFSCKGRGFCPSCCGRRMAGTSMHLADEVLPAAPLRQWVLSFPYPVRLHLAYDVRLAAGRGASWCACSSPGCASAWASQPGAGGAVVVAQRSDSQGWATTSKSLRGPQRFCGR